MMNDDGRVTDLRDSSNCFTTLTPTISFHPSHFTLTESRTRRCLFLLRCPRDCLQSTTFGLYITFIGKPDTDKVHFKLLGKSDHGVLSFQLNCYVDKMLHIKQRRNYNKGDYEKLRNELRIDWNSLLDPLQHDIDNQFMAFQEKLEAACDRCIPYIKSMSEVKWRRPPIDKHT